MGNRKDNKKSSSSNLLSRIWAGIRSIAVRIGNSFKKLWHWIARRKTDASPKAVSVNDEGDVGAGYGISNSPGRQSPVVYQRPKALTLDEAVVDYLKDYYSTEELAANDELTTLSSIDGRSVKPDLDVCSIASAVVAKHLEGLEFYLVAKIQTHNKHNPHDRRDVEYYTDPYFKQVLIDVAQKVRSAADWQDKLLNPEQEDRAVKTALALVGQKLLKEMLPFYHKNGLLNSVTEKQIGLEAGAHFALAVLNRYLVERQEHKIKALPPLAQLSGMAAADYRKGQGTRP
ncbi:MAG: hypothetical protein V4490_07280 [Pseudomonadota bacterium]